MTRLRRSPPCPNPGTKPPDALANVSPETGPASEDEQEAAPVSAEPSAGTQARKVKPKVQAKGGQTCRQNGAGVAPEETLGYSSAC
jgi:hypothetical protein